MIHNIELFEPTRLIVNPPLYIRGIRVNRKVVIYYNMEYY